MKNKFFQFLALALTAVVMASNLSCKQDTEEVFTLSVSPSVKNIIFSSDAQSATADGQSIDPNPTFTVETNQSTWIVVSNQEWVTVTKQSDNTFTMTVAANPGTEQHQEATVIVAAGKALPDTIIVTQIEPLIPITGIDVTPSSLELAAGRSFPLQATLVPSFFNEPGDNTLRWESDNPDIATVSNAGVVTALSKGLANITVMLERNTSVKTVIPVDVGDFPFILENIALNKPVTASSEYLEWYASYAVDGDKTTTSQRWITGFDMVGDMEHWLEVDLQGLYTISQVMIYFNPSGDYLNPMFKFQAWSGEAWIDVVSEDDKPGTTYLEYDFDPVTTDKVRLYIPPHPTNWTRLFEIEVWGYPEDINVLLNKPVTVSDHYLEWYGSYAVDGDKTTTSQRWISSPDNSVAHWLEVDLQGFFTISKVEIYFNPSGTDSNPMYSFQVWSDGTWVDVVSEDNNPWSTHLEYYFAPVTTDKVRLYIPPHPDNWTRLFEIEAYGFPVN